MRDGGSDLLYSNDAMWIPTVAAWLGGDVLAENVPLLSGRVSADASQQVPERLSMTVARYSVVNGARFDWFPGSDPAHPLARFGQVLDVAVVVGSPASRATYQTKLGRYLIQSWSEQEDGAISVEAVGVLQIAADDRLVSPTGPRAGGTLASEFARLLPERLSVEVDPGLVDRPCPAGLEWSEDRLAALYDIVDAWPARLRTDPQGGLHLLPPLPETPDPILTLADGLGGVVVSAPREDTRDQVYNRVVARADSSDAATDSGDASATIQAVADQTVGPMATTGPYGVVTRFYASPLLTTVEQAAKAAKSLLSSSMLPSRTIPVELVPDPRIDLDEPVEVLRAGSRWWGYVTAYDIPLTREETMRVDVGVVE